MSRDDHDDLSDEQLAARLRARRLGVTEPPRTPGPLANHLVASDAIVRTITEIEALVTAPWTRASLAKKHPWREEVVPKFHREMGQAAADQLAGQTILDHFNVTATRGRTETAAAEIRWYLDGQLALAWNAVNHAHAIKTYRQHGDDVRLRRAMQLCLRTHAAYPLRFFASVVLAQADPARLPNARVEFQIRAERTTAGIRSLWGERTRPDFRYKSGDDLIEALTAVQCFNAYV